MWVFWRRVLQTCFALAEFDFPLPRASHLRVNVAGMRCDMKIVSLLPSATEVVCELGLGGELVGVTHECDYPPFVTGLPKVTRTLIPHDATSREIDALVRDRVKTQRALYSLDMPTLEQLQPDLGVTQALC